MGSCLWYQQRNLLGTKNSPPAAVGGAFAVADGIMGIIDTATAETPQERCTTCNRVLSSPGCRAMYMHGSWRLWRSMYRQQLEDGNRWWKMLLSYLWQVFFKTNRIRRWGKTGGWEPRGKGGRGRKEQQVGVLKGGELGIREKRRESLNMKIWNKVQEAELLKLLSPHLLERRT